MAFHLIAQLADCQLQKPKVNNIFMNNSSYYVKQ